VLVGDDLDFDVPTAFDQPFHEDDRVGEGALRLGPGALQRVLELAWRRDDSDAPPTSTAAGLDDQRVADRRGVATTVLHVLHAAAAPRCDTDTGLLRHELGLDLVPEPAHGLRWRPDEHHAQIRAQLGESRVFGDEAPTDPRGVGPADAQCPTEFGVVEVGRRGAGAAQRDRLVGGAHERRPALGLGVQGDDPAPVTVLGVQLAHRPDQPHRGLAPVDHSDALEHLVHLPVAGCRAGGGGATCPSRR
jgi:hypothetical protein